MAKLYTREGSRNWFASFPNPEGGLTVRKSTGIPSNPALKDKAQLRANEIELAYWDSWKPGARVEEYLYEEMMVLFIQDTKPEGAHLYNIRTLSKFFAGALLSDIGAKQITGYKTFRIGKASNTVRRELSVLSAAINHVRIQYDWKVDNPVSGRLPKKGQSKLRWLRPKEARAIWLQADPNAKDFIILALGTGMRKSELTGMSADRCDIENRVFHLDPENQKNKRHGVVPMSSAVLDIIPRRISESSDLFDIKSPRKAIRGACDRAKVKDVTIHTFRHTFASWLVQAGVPLREVQELMRHASITETEKYAHLAPRLETQILHSPVFRPGQALEVIDNILMNQVLKAP